MSLLIDGERINFDWVEGIADEAHRILNLKSPPPPNPLCKFCAASTAIGRHSPEFGLFLFIKVKEISINSLNIVCNKCSNCR